MMNIEAMNNQYSVENRIVFKEGEGGIPMARLTCPAGFAEVYLLGAHLTSWKPKDQKPVLWVSREAIFKEGKAIRGGIPVCWPWFGAHPTDKEKPAHGFARTSMWSVKSSGIDGTCTRLTLKLEPKEDMRSLFPHDFELEYEILLCERLKVRLTTRNMGSENFNISQALHSYFSVGDIDSVRLDGLEQIAYIDQLQPSTSPVQQGPVLFDREVDRIYQDTVGDLTLRDDCLSRKIHIHRSGSSSVVVWNPWVDKSTRMADFGDDEYTEMLCIESSNAGADRVELSPGQSHSLTTLYSVES